MDTAGTQDFRVMVKDRIATTAQARASTPTDQIAPVGDIQAIVQAGLTAQAPRNIVQNAFTDVAYYGSAQAQEIAEYTTSITTATAHARVRITAPLSHETHGNSVFNITRNGTPICQNTVASPGLRGIGALSAPAPF